METIFSLFQAQAKRFPDNTAVIFDGEKHSYGELLFRTEKLASGFYHAGVRKGSVVGVLFPNSLDIIAVFYALQRLGAVPALLNYRLNSKELSLLVQKAKCTYLVYSSCYTQLVDGIRSEGNTDICYISDDSTERVCLEEMLSGSKLPLTYLPELRPDDMALYLFTGGTLSLPKVACITQEALFLRTALRFIAGNIDYKQTDNYLIFNPIFHQGGISQVMFMLSAGGCLTILKEVRVDKIAHAIEEYHITAMLLLPPSLCVKLREDPVLLKHDRRSVRLITLTGGATRHESILDIFDLFPNARICIGYGHTEDAANTNHSFSRDDFIKHPEIAGSIGKRHPFWELRIVDETGKEVGAGQPGECLARSPCMLQGYIDREAFDEEGWFHTGDILRYDEAGYYYFAGRSNDMIKSGGENVMAIEVENAINTHPEVVKCAVFGVTGGYLGETIWAAVVREAGSTLTEESLILYVKEKIARYKAPKRVFFLEDLLYTGVGKVDKLSIKDHCLKLSEQSCE